MFDFGIGYTEMVVIAVIAVIVIGPKDLPKVLRAFGKTMSKVRGMAREFQGHLDQAMREAGVDDIKKELKNIKSGVETSSNPFNAAVTSVKADTEKAKDDFKAMFGEGAGKTTEPAKPAA